jgi:hypothetical protein
MTENKSNLDKVFDITAKVCTILIPVVLFYFGNEFRKSQDLQAKEQQNYNRITTLLKSFSSDNTLERKLAIEFSKELANTHNFPMELLSVIEEVSSTDSTNSKEAQSVLNILSEKAKEDKNTEVEKKVNEIIENSPTKVYMQIPKGYDMKIANEILSRMKSEGYNMLGIERVDEKKSPTSSEVRYFKEKDQANAIKLSERITKMGYNIKVNQIKGYENKVTGSQLEIWLK